ncbi:LuxR C-terminal-related transcriptional regulator [Sphingopyxis sp.]|uniref:response regulator transcription factor n=1 Tax=Sphingopyxis sp. TaxID=1908224 RepID=UPI002631E940|nr:LuxR C-terminal-related transcriptional regulator [Sphingopyxis sp.]MCW0197228.1 LuxR C-terminal-related transcriptional regulator [Sphingopyxis sp.]
MSERGAPIHLILPDAVERAACFRTLADRPGRIVRSFASGDAWVEAGADADCAILLFHWRQPGGAGGEALLGRIAGRSDITAFVAASRLTIEESRAILRGGAHDLLPAPLDPRLVRRTIDGAVADWAARGAALARRREAETRLAALTPRERDILDALAAGLGNKAIARRLDLSPRTVEVHRANIMRRTDAGSVAELLRLAFIAELATNNLQYGATARFGAAIEASPRL